MASTLLVFSDVTMGDPEYIGGVISKLSDSVGAAGDVPGHKVIAWDLPVRKFNIQSQRELHHEHLGSQGRDGGQLDDAGVRGWATGQL